MNQQIPEWFFELKRKVYYKLEEYIGKPMSQEAVKRLEGNVNQLISEANVSIFQPNTQIPVNYITIHFNPDTKQVAIQFH